MQTICLPFCQKMSAEKPPETGRFFSCIICPQQSLGRGREGKGCFQVATHWIHNQVQTCISFRSSFFTKRMGNYTSPFPSTVAKQRKATTSCQACTAVRSHYKIPTFVRRIFIYFILAGITNIWQEIHVWLKSGKINIHIPADLGDVQRVID